MQPPRIIIRQGSSMKLAILVYRIGCIVVTWVILHACGNGTSYEILALTCANVQKVARAVDHSRRIAK